MVLAVAWAGYLIPKALKHHDEVARTRSIDRFSTAMRVLARREPVNRRDARLVVTPPRSTPSVVLPAVAAGRPTRLPSRRAAARAAARRRRHILLGLLVVDLVVVGLAGFALLPWWAVAIPAALTIAYLVLCRTQVRREDDASWTRDLPAASDADTYDADVALAPHRAIRVDATYGHVAVPRTADGFEEFSPEEDTITIPVVAADVREVDTVAVAAQTVDGGSLWDPLPVTLPTYVGKSRATRTVRTIDLSEPGTWSSGRSEADSKLVEEAAAVHGESTAAPEGQRAVGS